MSEAKNIKGIDEETWAEFKSLAAEHKLKSAEMFKKMVKEYKNNVNDFWNNLRTHKSICSPEEYNEIEKNLRNLRKEHGWRI